MVGFDATRRREAAADATMRGEERRSCGTSARRMSGAAGRSIARRTMAASRMYINAAVPPVLW